MDHRCCTGAAVAGCGLQIGQELADDLIKAQHRSGRRDRIRAFIRAGGDAVGNQLVLGLVVIVDGTGAEARFGENLAHGGGLNALAGKTARRRRTDLLAAVFKLVLTDAGHGFLI